jgi:cytochrome c-type biogenesis protein
MAMESVNIGIVAAFVAGTISFLSPCVLPLVPGYISIVSGISLDQLQENAEASIRRTVVLNSLVFILGFSLTFILLGAGATVIGQLLQQNLVILYRLAGILIVIFGLHLIGVIKIPFLYRDKRFHNVGKPRGLVGAFVLGLAFAFGWSPCLGPILAGILTYASLQDTAYTGMGLLAVYSAGLGLPFLITSLGINQFLGFYTRFRRHLRKVEVASGVFVVAIGLLIFSNNLSRFAAWFQPMNDLVLWMERSLFGS